MSEDTIHIIHFWIIAALVLLWDRFEGVYYNQDEHNIQCLS